MDMSGFWAQVPSEDKMTAKEFLKRFPKEARDFLHKDEDIGSNLKAYEFAYTVIPAFGPAGPVTDEDDAAFPDDDSDDGLSEPSVTGEKDLMAYRADIDELYSAGSGWLLWNY